MSHPGLEHGPIYLDYNATTPVDPRVVEAALPYLTTDFGNPSSAHHYAIAPRQAVVQTVAVVGYAAAGLAGGLLAPAVAFTPSFAFVLLGASRFDRIRGNHKARAFLDGAGPAAIGAILGSAISLTRALTQPWQYAVLAAALLLLLPLRRGVVLTLLCAGAAGALIGAAGGPLPH